MGLNGKLVDSHFSSVTAYLYTANIGIAPALAPTRVLIGPVFSHGGLRYWYLACFPDSIVALRQGLGASIALGLVNDDGVLMRGLWGNAALLVNCALKPRARKYRLRAEALPLDDDLLERLFGEEVRAGVVASPLDITDAWKNSYSCSTNHKVWAAKFTARHPNLVALEISSFKCGHDAPIYGVVEGIIEQSGTPYFCFKDLDENKPSGSIRIRVETIDYFLQRYREEVIRKRQAAQDIDAQLAALEAQLRREHGEMEMPSIVQERWQGAEEMAAGD
jgi:hypothetical protein